LVTVPRHVLPLAGRPLRATDLPLRAIADRTGHTSEFAFAKAFKREHGRSPRPLPIARRDAS